MTRPHDKEAFGPIKQQHLPFTNLTSSTEPETISQDAPRTHRTKSPDSQHTQRQDKISLDQWRAAWKL